MSKQNRAPTLADLIYQATPSRRSALEEQALEEAKAFARAERDRA
jgi:hypothetical protein